MELKLIKATIEQKPILANLIELYTYDFTKFCDFDIGDNGFYGYKYLPLYWIEATRFPYLIYVNSKIAGFVLWQQQLSITGDRIVWDIAEFFIMQKYKQHGLGTKVACKLWNQFKGHWQIRVLVNNQIACSFWLQAIEKFTSNFEHLEVNIEGKDWIIYTFASVSNGDE
ncbi:MAG: GNAT family N-acetyltransferase [Rickettsiaceae bacterium]|nr:MAG: GNAT family N-acetyltransferase [Rickettsiaceae bacterium]